MTQSKEQTNKNTLKKESMQHWTPWLRQYDMNKKVGSYATDQAAGTCSGCTTAGWAATWIR